MLQFSSPPENTGGITTFHTGSKLDNEGSNSAYVCSLLPGRVTNPPTDLWRSQIWPRLAGAWQQERPSPTRWAGKLGSAPPMSSSPPTSWLGRPSAHCCGRGRPRPLSFSLSRYRAARLAAPLKKIFLRQFTYDNIKTKLKRNWNSYEIFVFIYKNR